MLTMAGTASRCRKAEITTVPPRTSEEARDDLEQDRAGHAGHIGLHARVHIHVPATKATNPRGTKMRQTEKIVVAQLPLAAKEQVRACEDRDGDGDRHHGKQLGGLLESPLDAIKPEH